MLAPTSPFHILNIYVFQKLFLHILVFSFTIIKWKICWFIRMTFCTRVHRRQNTNTRSIQHFLPQRIQNGFLFIIISLDAHTPHHIIFIVESLLLLLFWWCDNRVCDCILCFYRVIVYWRRQKPHSLQFRKRRKKRE